MGNKLLYYVFGSYIYCYGESFYKTWKNLNIKESKQTFDSNAYVLSFVLLSPIVLPFHTLNFVYKNICEYKN